MIDDLDIWRSAKLLVDRHGEDTTIVAAQRADAMLAAGDIEGLAVWKQILAAVEELQRTAPREGEPKH